MSAYTLSIGLIILGFLLILAEIFIIPGLNIFGIAGFICVGIGIYMAYDRLTRMQANTIMVVSLGLTVLIVWTFFKIGAYKRFILTDKLDKKAGYSAVSRKIADYLGKDGTTLTPLRPSGAISIQGDRIDVVTEGEFIEQGKPVVVVKIEGNRVIVRKKDENQST